MIIKYSITISEFVIFTFNVHSKNLVRIFAYLTCRQLCFSSIYKDKIHKRRKKEEDIKRCSYKKKDDFELTHENLCKSLGVEFKNQDIGITITQYRKFFEKYNIGLVVDLYCKKIPNTEIKRTEQRINIHLKHYIYYFIIIIVIN